MTFAHILDRDETPQFFVPHLISKLFATQIIMLATLWIETKHEFNEILKEFYLFYTLLAKN